MKKLENQNIEYKQSWHDECLKWICGFANSDGGKMYIGMDDKGNVIGIDNPKDLLEIIPNKIADTMTILPKVNLIKKNRKDVIEIIVDSYFSPVSYKGKYYRRVGATNREVDGNELKKIFDKKYNIDYVDFGMDNIKLNDIDSRVIDIFKENAIRSKRMKKSDLQCSKKDLLEKLNLVNDEGKIKRAAVLLFSKEPQKYFLNSHIKIGYFDKNDADLKFQDEIYGSLITQVDDTMDLLFIKYLKGLIYYKGVQRIDQYPIDRDAFREILVNAIVHKDYSIKNPIQISVYKDKIYIFNVGHFPSKLNTEVALYKKHSSKPYNPTIANVFYKAGFIEGWGRGFEKIMDGVRRNPGNRPKYDIDDEGVMVLYEACKQYKKLLAEDTTQTTTQTATQTTTQTVAQTKEELSSKIIDIIKHNKHVTLKEIAEKLNKSRDGIKYHITKMQKAGKIRHIGKVNDGYWEIIN